MRVSRRQASAFVCCSPERRQASCGRVVGSPRGGGVGDPRGARTFPRSRRRVQHYIFTQTSSLGWLDDAVTEWVRRIFYCSSFFLGIFFADMPACPPFTVKVSDLKSREICVVFSVLEISCSQSARVRISSASFFFFFFFLSYDVVLEISSTRDPPRHASSRGEKSFEV